MDILKNVALIGIGFAFGFTTAVKYTSKVAQINTSEVYDSLKTDANAKFDEAKEKLNEVTHKQQKADTVETPVIIREVPEV